MMSSNTSEPAGTAGADTASSVQSTAPETTTNTDATSSAPATAADISASAGQASGEVVPPTYQPNFKFKAFGVEKELDEFWRPLIKDQDSEKKVKDLFTRAEAFDELKSRYEGTQNEFSQVYNEYVSLDKDVKRVASFLNRGDLDNFFRSVGLTEEKIYEWVENKIEMQNLPPDQKKALEMQAMERQRSYDLELEKNELVQQYQTQAVQARTMQLDMLLSRPEVSQAASAWDSKMGQLGAFRDLVVEEAQKAWFAEKVDLSAEQAVQRVLTRYGKLLEGGVAPQAPMAPQGSAPQVQQKPVIPAVQGRGTSPVKRSPKSIDDLKAMAKELGV